MQRNVVDGDGVCSGDVDVVSDVHQGSVFEPLLVLLYTSDPRSLLRILLKVMLMIQHCYLKF